MKFSAIQTVGKRKKADALILPCWKGGELAFADSVLSEAVATPLELGDFSGKASEVAILYHEGERLILVGLGEKGDCNAEVLRRAHARVIRRCQPLKVKSLTVCLPKGSGLSGEEMAAAVTEGLLLANEAFDLQKEKKEILVEKAVVVGATPKQMTAIKDTLAVVEAVRFARLLALRNGCEITAPELGRVAKKLAKANEKLKATVFNRERIEREKMGLLLAVNQGSAIDPAFIILEYKGNPRSKEHTVICGKGITFDTGGVCLKTGAGLASLATMRTDMSAAANVLATVKAVADLELKVNLTAVVAATDNAIGSRSYLPGDVFRSYSGKTVEIGNTDAEGRLVLADALAYAAKNLKPTRLLDMGTLTGSCVIALGESVGALMTDDESLAKELLAASERSGDALWRMPLVKDYRKALDSAVADINHIGNRAGGSIQCGLFLQEFAGDVPWAHLDIAGPGFPDKPTDLAPNRSTGFGVRLFVNWLRKDGR